MQHCTIVGGIVITLLVSHSRSVLSRLLIEAERVLC